MNQNSNDFIPTPAPKPWFLQADEKPPKDYNPYEAEAVYPTDESAPADTLMRPWENSLSYQLRMQAQLAREKALTHEKRKSFINGAFFPLLLTLFMVSALSSVVGMFSGFISEDAYTTLCNLQMVISYAALFPVAFYVYSVGKKCKTYTFFKKPQASKFYVARWAVIAIGVTYAVSTAFYYLFELFKSLGMHVNELPTVPHEGALNTVVYFIAVVICAPVFEELLFRGFLLTKLSRFGAWFAIITSAVAFGLYHQNHFQLFYATAFGVIAGFIAMRTRSVIPSLIAHMALNAYSFLSELFLSFTNYTDKSALDPDFVISGNPVVVAIVGILDILLYVLIVVGVVMLITEIAKNRNQFKFDNDGSLMTKGEKTKLLFSSVIVIILLVLLISNLITVSFLDLDAYASEMEALLEG